MIIGIQGKLCNRLSIFCDGLACCWLYEPYLCGHQFAQNIKEGSSHSNCDYAKLVIFLCSLHYFISESIDCSLSFPTHETSDSIVHYYCHLLSISIHLIAQNRNIFLLYEIYELVMRYWILLLRECPSS